MLLWHPLTYLFPPGTRVLVFNTIVQGYNCFNVVRMYNEICKKDKKNYKCATSINMP